MKIVALLAATLLPSVALIAACSDDSSPARQACDDSSCANDPKKTEAERAACVSNFKTQSCSLELEAYAACANSNRVCAPEKRTDEVRTGEAIEKNCTIQSARLSKCQHSSLADAGTAG